MIHLQGRQIADKYGLYFWFCIQIMIKASSVLGITVRSKIFLTILSTADKRAHNFPDTCNNVTLILEAISSGQIGALQLN